MTNHSPMCERCGTQVPRSMIDDGECKSCQNRSDGFDPRKAILGGETA